MYLDKKLEEYTRSGIYPFHMPGHKRQLQMDMDAYAIDITEIDGFDDLHDADGVIRDAQNRAAALYDAKNTYLLVNGSTCGILTAISAAVPKHGKILLARNSHKAAYHAVYLRELSVEYLYPEITQWGIQGVITPKSVEAAFEADSNISAVMITSPTYDGIVSDIAKIAEVVHEYGAVLIVDEAHGAHFGFHPYFPQTAVRMGADVVIQSLHKTLPSMTQTALLHIASNRISSAKVQRFLDIYETSSPSYILMAGMDRCFRMLENHSGELFLSYQKKLVDFYHRTAEFTSVEVMCGFELPAAECYAFDPSKLVIRATKAGLMGSQLHQLLLKKYQLQMEMCSGEYVLAMTSIMDTQEGFDRLCQALYEIEKSAGDNLQNVAEPVTDFIARVYTKNEKKLEIAEALEADKKMCVLERAAGQIAGDYVFLYPPGIPILVPGEYITSETAQHLAECIRLGLNVKGVTDKMLAVCTAKAGL